MECPVEKIVRSVCLFREQLQNFNPNDFEPIIERLLENGFAVQTKRLCLSHYVDGPSDRDLSEQGILLGLGSISIQDFMDHREDFFRSANKSITLDLSEEEIGIAHVELLFKLFHEWPQHTFRCTLGLNLPHSSPFFPSASYGRPGWSIGLQATNLAASCSTLSEWLQAMKRAWHELCTIFKEDKTFLGIDSSIAPLGNGESSFIHLAKRFEGSFAKSVLSDFYTSVSSFIKRENPRPVGLCGLMFPCVEDVELAGEYERGCFSIERNLFLSLHSGVGIDVYPVGLDENPQTILNILRLTKSLSCKHKKPLSIRFISDGRARIGETTVFQNPYLCDVRVQSLT